ncbi:hypothetical protein Mapa_009116 [Marchantia paleacea]|nr:hypothetical protein Mapa_009116 [Marchantia paleacea]
MKSSQLMHTYHIIAMLQNPEWSVNRSRGIRGMCPHKDHLSIPGCKVNRNLITDSLLDSRHGWRLNLTKLRSRRCSGITFSGRKDSGNISSLERLVKWTVRSEQEQKEDDLEEERTKPAVINSDHSKLEGLMIRAQNVQMTARIFTSMMTWVVLFFMSSVLDGDSQSSQDSGKKNGKRGPRR